MRTVVGHLGWSGSEPLRAADRIEVSVAGHRPPVVQFALDVLEAADSTALLRRCVHAFVELFGVTSARVVDAAGTVIVGHGDDRAAGDLVRWTYKLSSRDAPRLELQVALPVGDDLFVIRQQLVDLVAVVRSGLSHHRIIEQRHREAHEDELTGLENRRSIELCLRAEVERSIVDHTPLCVMLIDLDGFKSVNDEHGHLAGDDVLQVAAAVLREHLRASDRVARWGGDEFLVVFPGMSADAVLPVADRLRAAFADDERSRGATMSIGVADTNMARMAGRVTGASLLARADELLYESKRGGRNRVAADTMPIIHHDVG